MEKKNRLLCGKKLILALVLWMAATVMLACSNPPAAEKDAPGTAQNSVPVSQAETPELATPAPTVFIDAPEGFIVNEVGATDAEVAAVFNYMKDREYLPEKLDNCGFRLFFYARQTWHGGVLLAAGESERGETTAELYFVKNGELIMCTRGSNVWSINYTHFEGETIVYGKSFAWDNRPLATDEVTAEFYDGTTVTVEMAFEPNGAEEIGRGFICVAPSLTWLKSLEIKKDGKVVVDDRSGDFLFSPEDEPPYGEEESIRNRTQFAYANLMEESLSQPSISDILGGRPMIVFEDGTAEAPAYLFYWRSCEGHEGIPPDIWRSNNGRYHRAEAKAASHISVHIAAPPDASGVCEYVGELEILGVYWADLSIIDDAACIRAGELVCPSEKGFYILILATEHGYFVQRIRVV